MALLVHVMVVAAAVAAIRGVARAVELEGAAEEVLGVTLHKMQTEGSTRFTLTWDHLDKSSVRVEWSDAALCRWQPVWCDANGTRVFFNGVEFFNEKLNSLCMSWLSDQVINQ